MAKVFTTQLLYTIFNLDLSDLSIQPRLFGPFVFFPFPIAKAMLVSCSNAARETHLRRKSKCNCYPHICELR